MSQPTVSVSLRAQHATIAESKSLVSEILNDAWDPKTNPSGFFNVGIAENVLMHDALLGYINQKVDLPAKYLTYNDGGGGSRRLKGAITEFLNRHLQPIIPLQPHHIIVTNGVSAAIEHLSWVFTNEGEGILLGKPYYGAFIPDMSTRPAAAVIPVDFNGSDPFGVAAVECYEHSLLAFQHETRKKVRALMLCHPHNPLGRCYPRDTIVEVMKLCQKYRLHLISDEIYALSTWENRVDTNPEPVEFESVLAINKSNIIDENLVHVLWGMSKDFGANGLRIGTIISQANRELHAALQGPSLYSYVSGLSDYITANILRDTDFTDRYLRLNREKLAAAHQFVAGYLKDRGFEYQTGCNAAFFLWVNLGKRYLERHPQMQYEGHSLTAEVMERLLQQKVFLASGIAFGSEHPGWFRIVFSQPMEYLQESLRRIEAALDE
ncbi:pyridoxal phosphate-dependent transferase [Aspergillus leporis]|jgi:aspartate/methionine/tyrosine aminotransferase|uniref:Pyridoxal phosphate-dependent transferase n=1 Tax=Aspergillus leporis TaxID=41062 RepID=A0A5N5X741_9EURO|nr:pyridoxal phosphate-dependent transferase [Aspergillus leporis]